MKFNVSLNRVNIETVGGASCKAAHMSSRSLSISGIRGMRNKIFLKKIQHVQ